jgi:hypothetical protein
MFRRRAANAHRSGPPRPKDVNVTARRIIVASALAILAEGCALNRPHVKSLRDKTADRIQFDTVVQTTVSALNGIPSKCGPTADHRVRAEEFQVYRVVGTVVRVKRERDHDIHIVLADVNHPRDHLVIESDDPDFRDNVISPYREKLVTARRMFDALLAASGVQRLENLKGTVVRVTGVGFFDINHFQVGRSRSCLELHPMLSIERVDSEHAAIRDGLVYYVW